MTETGRGSPPLATRLEAVRLDARHAGRSLRQSPGVAAAVVATLALGIGGVTALFSVVRTLLLEPLPYRAPDRLAFVWSDLTAAGYPRAPLAGPELDDLRRRSRLFSGFGAIWPNTAAFTGEDDPEQVRIGLVTRDFFQVLGAEAALGRTFAPEDEAPTSPPSILLGWPLFERRFGGQTAIVGQRVLVNGVPTTVVGVMPPGFKLLLPPDANVPDDLQAFRLFPFTIVTLPRGQQFLRVVGRLRPGVTLAQGQEEVAAIGRALAAELTDYGRSGWRLFALGLQAEAAREAGPAVLALFGGACLLLVIACVNVAGLLVARAARRGPETALRLALGAGRARVLRQHLLEGLILAGLGGLLALPLGRAGLALLVSLRPETLSRIDGARFDLRLFGLALAVALVWGALVSLFPAAEVFRTRVRAVLDRGERGGGATLSSRTRAALVVVQVALSTVLLVTSGLVWRGLAALEQVDPGFDPRGILTFRVAPGSRYAAPEAAHAFARRLRDELSRLPGVSAVGAVSHLPYDNLPNWSTPYLPEGVADPSLAREADARAVDPGFFSAVGATLLAGRGFTEDDGPGRPAVAVVDERLARRLWPGQGAVGRTVMADPQAQGAPTVRVTVVGVVRHLRHRRPTEEVREQMYFSARQVRRSPMAWLVRTPGEAASLASGVRAALARVDPQQPLYDTRPLADYVAEARAVRVFTGRLALAFAAAALALCCLGLYGVVAYAVARRRRELGIRLALGARAGQVVALVVGHGGRLVGAGLAAGLLAAAAAARALRSQLFGVTPLDGPSYLAAAAVLALAGLLACWVPARRATSISPAEALRSE